MENKRLDYLENLSKLRNELCEKGEMLDLIIIDCCYASFGALELEELDHALEITKRMYFKDEQHLDIACYTNALECYMESENKTINDINDMSTWDLLEIAYEHWY